MADYSGQEFLQTFYSPSAPETVKEDILYFPINKLCEAVTSGKIPEGILNDCSLGPIIYQFLCLCEKFQEINILRPTDQEVNEVNAWLHGEAAAFDWSPVSKYIANLAGKNSEEIEKKVKEAVKKVVKYEGGAVAVPKADCVTSVWLNRTVSASKEALAEHLKKMSPLVKLGGQLVLFASLNETFYQIGDRKVQSFPLTEAILKTALAEAGFAVTVFDTKPAAPKAVSDAQSYVFVIAMKVRLIK